MSQASKWREAVFTRDGGRCAAEMHDYRCMGHAEHAHHLFYKSQIPKWAYWVVDNGLAVSNVCHMLAHSNHNKNVSPERMRRAADAVNATIPDDVPELRVRYTGDAA